MMSLFTQIHTTHPGMHLVAGGPKHCVTGKPACPGPARRCISLRHQQRFLPFSVYEKAASADRILWPKSKTSTRTAIARTGGGTCFQMFWLSAHDLQHPGVQGLAVLPAGLPNKARALHSTWRSRGCVSPRATDNGPHLPTRRWALQLSAFNAAESTELQWKVSEQLYPS